MTLGELATVSHYITQQLARHQGMPYLLRDIYGQEPVLCKVPV